MLLSLAVLVGKLVRIVVRLRGGGSAYPGTIALSILPSLMERTLRSFRLGVVLISGSNGKSTTTALAVAALESQGLKVFTNSSGSNMPRGIASAIVRSASLSGAIKADIAVIEVDEGYALLIARKLALNWFVLTNIQIDQLNRFYEPDRVFEMLSEAAGFASRGVLLNGNDSNLVRLGSQIDKATVHQVVASREALEAWPKGALAAPIFGTKSTQLEATIAATVESESGGLATIEIAGESLDVSMPGKGLHFALGAALALSLTRLISPESFDSKKAIAAISSQPSVYGRGEIVSFKGHSFQILMMKNPPSMQANLVSLGYASNNIWIAVDEGTPDTSWIYDIDFTGLSVVEVVSGSMAWQLAIRLRYAGIIVNHVEPDSKAALSLYTSYLSTQGQPGTLLSNYEQMMLVRKLIGLHDLEGGRR